MRLSTTLAFYFFSALSFLKSSKSLLVPSNLTPKRIRPKISGNNAYMFQAFSTSKLQATNSVEFCFDDKSHESELPKVEDFDQKIQKVAKRIVETTYMTFQKKINEIHENENPSEIGGCVIALLLEHRKYSWVLRSIDELDPGSRYDSMLANHVLKINPSLVAENIGCLRLTDDQVNELASRLVQHDGAIVLQYFDSLERRGATIRKSIPELIDKYPISFCKYIDRIGLEKTEVLERLDSLFDDYPQEVSYALVRFKDFLSITSYERVAFARKLAKKNIDILSFYYSAFIDDAISLSDRNEILKSAFGCVCLPVKMLEDRNLWQLLKFASQLQKSLLNIDFDCAGEYSKVKIGNLIERIFFQRNESFQSETIRSLTQILSSQSEKISEFVTYISSLSKHGLLTAVLAYGIIFEDKEIDQEKISNLLQVFGSKSFKNTFKQSKVMDALILLKNSNLPGDTKTRLLLAVASEVKSNKLGRKELTSDLLDNIVYLKIIALLSDNEDFFEYEDIDFIKDRNDLKRFVQKISLGILQLDKNPKNEEALQAYFDKQFEPYGFIVFASRQLSLASENKSQSENNMEWIKKFASMILFGKSATRYEYQRQLNKLREENQYAYDVWSEKKVFPLDLRVNSSNLLELYDRTVLKGEPIYDDEEFYSGYEYFSDVFGVTSSNNNARLSAKSKASDFAGTASVVSKSLNHAEITSLGSTRNWEAFVSGDINVILKMGSHVSNSCQAEDRPGRSNQGLLGAMLNAYEIGINDNQGKLICRRLLFLCRNEDTKRTSLFMPSNIYGVEGYDKRLEQVLIFQAIIFANHLGLDLIEYGINEGGKLITLYNNGTPVWIDPFGLLADTDPKMNV